MIDIEAKRAANKARLLGLESAASVEVEKITQETLANDPEKAWHIISLATKEKKDSKELQYPDLMPVQVVGVTAQKNGNKRERTNVATARRMYEIRNSMNSFATGDVEDAYVEFFTGVVETLDVYAQTVITDLLEENKDLLDRVYEIDLAEKEAQSKNLKNARSKARK